MPTLRRSLLFVIGSTILIGTASMMLVAYRFGHDELGEAFDEMLRVASIAAARSPRAGTAIDLFDPGAVPELARRLEADDEDEIAIVLQRLSPGGEVLASRPASERPPVPPSQGLHRLRADGALWHVFRLDHGDGSTLAAQRESTRRMLARDAALDLLVPAIALVAALAAALTWALGRVLAPLDRAAATLRQRRPGALEPLDTTGIPGEALPFVDATNDLMKRLDESLATQRRFVADAAHELRTPLAVLRIQTRNLCNARDDDGRASAIFELEAGMKRAERLVAGLLDLSRADDSGRAEPFQRFWLGAAVEASIGRVAPLVRERGCMLHFETSEQAWIDGEPEQIGILVDNLLRNAINHAPSASTIDVAVDCDEHHVYLSIVDQGPGIAPDQRERVFERFARAGAMPDDWNSPGIIPGSGLGLSIVRAIADRHDAGITLADGPRGVGLSVRVRFARKPPAS
ncbi:MAG: ATP-binding protein [Burkholderiaceae bacterium]